MPLPKATPGARVPKGGGFPRTVDVLAPGGVCNRWQIKVELDKVGKKEIEFV
jgi:hypothetical protein